MIWKGFKALSEQSIIFVKEARVMAKFFEIKERSLILFNEDELEPSGLYHKTNQTTVSLYKNIPKIRPQLGYDGRERFSIENEYSEDRFFGDLASNANMDSFDFGEMATVKEAEPFMVLQKEKKYAKYTCVQIVQGDLVVWIVQEYPNLRKEFHGYFNALEWPNPKEVNDSLYKLQIQRLTKTSSEETQFTDRAELEKYYLKKYLSEKIMKEKIKKKNSPMFDALRAKYAKKT